MKVAVCEAGPIDALGEGDHRRRCFLPRAVATDVLRRPLAPRTKIERRRPPRPKSLARRVLVRHPRRGERRPQTNALNRKGPIPVTSGSGGAKSKSSGPLDSSGCLVFGTLDFLFYFFEHGASLPKQSLARLRHAVENHLAPFSSLLLQLINQVFADLKLRRQG